MSRGQEQDVLICGAVLMELLLDATGDEDGVGLGERPAERPNPVGFTPTFPKKICEVGNKE